MPPPPEHPPHGIDEGRPLLPPDHAASPDASGFGALEQALASVSNPAPQVSLRVPDPNGPPPLAAAPPQSAPHPPTQPAPEMTPQPTMHHPQPAPETTSPTAPQPAPQPTMQAAAPPAAPAPAAPQVAPPQSQPVSAPPPGAADPYQPSPHLQAQSPGAPSLPSVSAAPPTPTAAVPVMGNVGTEGAFTPAQMAAISAGASANVTIGGPSMATRLARTLMFAVLAAGVGLGANLAWQWNQDRTASEDTIATTAGEDGVVGDVDPAAVSAATFQPIGEPLPTEPVADPTGRYLETTITRTVDETTTVHDVTVDLATGDVEGTVTHPNGDGADFEVRAIGEQVQYKGVDDPNWVDARELPDPAVADDAVGIARGAGVHTLTELVPPSLVPHVLVVQERDVPLAVSPLGTASNEELTVRYYKLQFDFRAWAREHPHEAHSHPFLGETWSNLELWVDGAGVVRQYHITLFDGSTKPSSYQLGSLTHDAPTTGAPNATDARDEFPEVSGG